MNRLLAFILLVVSNLAPAQEMHVFSNGGVADADEVNENFEVLKGQLDSLFSPLEGRQTDFWSRTRVDVDCTNDSFAFQKAFNDTLNKDRLEFVLTGTCLFNGGLNLAARFISIRGNFDAVDSGLCASPKPQLITRYESDLTSDVVVNNMGTLLLSCLQLGSDEYEGSGYGSIWAYANSLIRMDRVVDSGNAGLAVYLRSGSLFRYLGYRPGQGFSGWLFSDMGRVDLFGDGHNIESLSLKNGSIFNCRSCGGNIFGGEVTGGSSVHASAAQGNINIAGLGLEHGSNLYTERSENYSVDVSNISYLEPSDRGREIYAAQNMEIETIGLPQVVNPPVNDACGADSQIQFVKEVADSYYYWYDELAPVNAADYSDPSAYLAAIMQPIWSDGTGRDPGFSYLTTIEADTQRFTSGTFYGYGVRYRIIDNNFYFADSYEAGPAHTAGIRRGQRLVAVKRAGETEFETWDQLVARNAELPDAVFGARGELQTTVFRVEYEGVESEISVTTAETTTPPLAGEALVIERNGDSPVGYINFRSFIDAADGPLRAAAIKFAEAGVTDLIIDLRYNGGGLLRVAETFLNLLAGETANGQLSYIINLNDKHQNQNSTATFSSIPETFSPQRIAFITTGGSASASELLINGLAPHVELAIVGSETSGKAVGQFAFDLDSESCETRLRLIAFEIQNGEGLGGYYNGLVSTGRFTFFEAADDATRPFGDSEEDSFVTAFNWLSGIQPKRIGLDDGKIASPEPLGVAGFDATWPINRDAPLNPDGSVRSF